MALRMERAQSNARKLCSFLAMHPRVLRIYWPGFEAGEKNGVSEDELKIHAAQAKGPGTLISFETGCPHFSRRLMDAFRIFKITVSFGSVHSLCEMPCDMSHAAIPDEDSHLPRDLIRLSIGIEHWRDLQEDLKRAFGSAARSAIPDERLKRNRFDSKFEDLP